MFDTLPRDRGGQKFLALHRSESSAGGFLLFKGIAGSKIGDWQYGHLAIGTHTNASVVSTGAPGVLLGGVVLNDLNTFKTTASNGKFRVNGISEHGEIFVTPASMVTSVVTTSRNEFQVSSSQILGINAVFTADNASITLSNGDKLRHVVTSKGSPWDEYRHFPGGMSFSDVIRVDISNVGVTSAIIYFKQ